MIFIKFLIFWNLLKPTEFFVLYLNVRIPISKGFIIYWPNGAGLGFDMIDKLYLKA